MTMENIKSITHAVRNIPISPSHIWVGLIGIASYQFLKIVYRLYFHPLARIPGPKLTAITSLYEFYYDIICDGRFTFQVEKMHKQYGPVVRINPREVHVSDPDFFHEIYASSSRKRNKDPQFVASFGLPEATISTADHDHHRFRRGLVNDFFSKRSVLGLSNIVEERVEKLMERFEGFYKTGKPVNVSNAFAALTSDIITHYCYGKVWHFIEDEEFRSDIRQAGEDFGRFSHINRFFPALTTIMRLVPLNVMAKLMPGKSALFEFQTSIFHHFSLTINGKTITVSDDNIFKRMMDPKLPASERTLSRIQDDGFTFLVAGSETTMRMLTYAVYYLTENKTIRDKLRSELKQVLPTPSSTTTWPELEKLPYFTAVINEVLRISDVAIMRLPRVAPTESLKYKDLVIPPWTPISTSIKMVHKNPDIFPEPDKFDPERWLRAAEKGQPLTRYLVAFGKGTRSCIGVNLAYMELYLTIAYAIRRFNFEMYETGPEEVRITRERVVGYPESGTFQVHAKITSLVDE